MPTTNYLEILVTHPPSSTMGPDKNGRVRLFFNLFARADHPASNFLDDLAALIVNAGLGRRNVSLFVGQIAMFPTGNGPYTLITATGGLSPKEDHQGSKDDMLSAQILTVGSSFDDTRTRCWAIYNLLDGTRDQLITS